MHALIPYLSVMHSLAASRMWVQQYRRTSLIDYYLLFAEFFPTKDYDFDHEKIHYPWMQQYQKAFSVDDYLWVAVFFPATRDYDSDFEKIHFPMSHSKSWSAQDQAQMQVLAHAMDKPSQDIGLLGLISNMGKTVSSYNLDPIH